MKKILLLLFLILIITCCLSQKKNNRATLITTLSDVKGTPITIEVEKGNQWSHETKFGIMTFSIIPQIAVWIEDNSGNYIDTLYVTKAFGRQKWFMSNNDPYVTFRTSSLPYWMNKRIKAGYRSPTKNNPLADSITSATPKGSFTLKSKIKSDLKEFVVLMELNRAFDVNEFFHDNEIRMTEGFIDGQPSIIYSAKVKLDGKEKSFKMNADGHGGEKGNDAGLYTDLKKITTAMEIIKSATIIF